MKVETNINTSNPSGVQTSPKKPHTNKLPCTCCSEQLGKQTQKIRLFFLLWEKTLVGGLHTYSVSVNWIINIYKPLNVTVARQSGRILSIWSGGGQFFVPSSHHVHFIIIKHFIMLWAYVCLYLIRKKAKQLRSMRIG